MFASLCAALKRRQGFFLVLKNFVIFFWFIFFRFVRITIFVYQSLTEHQQFECFELANIFTSYTLVFVVFPHLKPGIYYGYIPHQKCKMHLTAHFLVLAREGQYDSILSARSTPPMFLMYEITAFGCFTSKYLFSFLLHFFTKHSGSWLSWVDSMTTGLLSNHLLYAINSSSLTETHVVPLLLLFNSLSSMKSLFFDTCFWYQYIVFLDHNSDQMCYF